VAQGRRGIIWAVVAVCSVGAPAAARSVAPPSPVFARTVVLAPVGGRVLVNVAGANRGFVRLRSPRAVPVGTLVDTTAGTVRLTSANPNRQTQSGRFFRGIFRIEQRRSAGGLVDLAIRDNLTRSACATTAAAVGSAAVNPKVLGLLRGTARGRFRTTGRFAAATVRGTDWGVRDRCDGTLTVVRRGVVVVRDFRRHKSVIVRAGQTYLAKAG
jgi:hypothetical protein